MALSETAPHLGLSPAVIDRLRATFAKYPAIEKVLVFGSRAQGIHRPGSDIDLAVVAPSLSGREFAQLWGEIDDLPIAFKMDLIHFDALENAEMRQHILRHGRVLYSSRERQ